MWNYEGMTIYGKYMGTIPVVGRVTLSRVALGGRVHHHIALNSSVNVYGSVRKSVILEHEFVERIKD